MANRPGGAITSPQTGGISRFFPFRGDSTMAYAVRSAVSGMENQRIGEVSRLAIGAPDIIPLWFGEPDLDTPTFVRDAAIAAIDAGHTRYVNKRGVPQLREAIREYTLAQWGVELPLERFTVTGSGMTAIMIAV